MRWISCKKKFPPKDKMFLFSYLGIVGIGTWTCVYKTEDGEYFSDEVYLTFFDESESFYMRRKDLFQSSLHWMPIPDPFVKMTNGNNDEEEIADD